MPNATYSRIVFEVEEHVAWVTLSHPPQNIIDFEMMDELQSALDTVEQRAEISIILFQGSETAFSAGVDIPSHTTEKVPTMLAKFHGVIMAIARSKKITIASVKGSCLGGGAELALMCDMVFTATTAKWGFPEIKLACFPPVAAVALSAVVGQKRAAELVLTGRTITGQEAEKIGLANKALPDSELNKEVNATLHELGKLSSAALQVAKKAFYAWDSIHLDKGLSKAEQIYKDELLKTADMEEGIRAWVEKRTARWQGK